MSRDPRPAGMRGARRADAKAIHALITANVAGGHLLPRSFDEVASRVTRFVVAVRGRTIVGCAELAPLSRGLAEIRSLTVAAPARRQGIGTRLVGELRHRAHAAGYEQLCVLTHAPEYFASRGFSIVPHLWVQEKVFVDCVNCPKFRQCGQFAMIVPLAAAAGAAADRHAPIPDRPIPVAMQVA